MSSCNNSVALRKYREVWLKLEKSGENCKSGGEKKCMFLTNLLVPACPLIPAGPLCPARPNLSGLMRRVTMGLQFQAVFNFQPLGRLLQRKKRPQSIEKHVHDIC
jgi:hypothetical protein